MKRGDRVVRIALSTTADGQLEEQGTIETVFSDGMGPYGLRVIWDRKPKESQYVAPGRVALLETWQQTRTAGA